MALPPKFAGQKYTTKSGTTPETTHTIELYLDYVCPFSKKMFDTLRNQVLPSPAFRTRHAPRVSLLFRQQIQPWHPSSTLVHEAALAVLQLAPRRFWDYSAALFDAQRAFFDEPVAAETRNATYARLAQLAARAVGVDEARMLELLRVGEGEAEERNMGNDVTGDVKAVVKANRLTGVHVTPTVLFNGVPENSISSSWTKEQWEEWMDNNIV